MALYSIHTDVISYHAAVISYHAIHLIILASCKIAAKNIIYNYLYEFYLLFFYL